LIRTRLVLAFGIVILLQAYTLYYLLTYGSLIGLIPWDDCAIILRGITNIDVFAHATSILGGAASVFRLDVHSPTSDIQTMIGLVMTGGATWGPYALNAVYLLVCLYLLSKTAGLKSSLAFWLVTALLLTQPLTFSALSELKSDWQGGLLMAAAIFILFDAQEADSDTQRFAGSSVLSLALLTKMTSVYMPILAAGIFIAMESYGALRTASMPGAGFKIADAPKAIGNQAARTWRVQLICLTVILVPFLVFFVYQFQHLTDYIQNGLSLKWRDGFSLHQRFDFYRPRHNPGWGRLHELFAGFFLLALIAAAVRRNWLHVLACLGVLAIAIVFVIPLLLAPTSNFSFSAAFLGTLIGGTLVAMRILTTNAAGLGAAISAVVILIAALTTAMPQRPPMPDRAYAQRYQAMYNDMLDKMLKTERSDHPKVAFAVEVYAAPFPNLFILHFRRTARLLRLDRADELKDAAALASGADYVVTMTQTPGLVRVPDVSMNYPISADLAAADRAVTASGHYERLSDYPVRGGTLHFYMRLPG
jgi:hypothetical protein